MKDDDTITMVTRALDLRVQGAERWRRTIAGSSPAMTIGVAFLALTLLAACGKKGGPVPPGPANEIVYPRTYPSR